MSASEAKMPPQPPTTLKNSSHQHSIIHNHNSSFQHNNNSLSFRDDQVQDLMSSIQNKLSMLVCEDSCDASDF